MIKLRAWDLWEEEMLDNIHFTWQDCEFKSLNECLNSDRFVFQQSTRLKDCWNDEIYEGDIIRYFSQFELNNGDMELKYDFTGEISYKLGACYVGDKNLNVLLQTCDPRHTIIGIVGNIYEGKEE